MPPKGASTVAKPVRLQTVSQLRVRRPDQKEISPCLAPMSAMLSCWASSAAANAAVCGVFEQALRECMDFGAKKPSRKSSINYHLGRLYPKISGPTKRNGSLG